MSMQRNRNRRALRDHSGLQGRVEIEVRRRGILIERSVQKNIILFQGNGEIIRTLSTISPTTTPRIVNRMAVGDQGTIPADPTVPKVPTKDLTSLFHEIYRKDIDSRVITINPGSTFTISATLINNNPVGTTASTTGIASGMTVTGTGVPANTVVLTVDSSTEFTMSNPATVSGAESLTFSGAANETLFVATFAATDIALTAYSNPSQPRINEVGLVFIDPTAPGGVTRSAVTAPNPPPTDEVLLSIRCFKSVPFEIANDVSVTIRYTIFME